MKETVFAWRITAAAALAAAALAPARAQTIVYAHAYDGERQNLGSSDGNGISSAASTDRRPTALRQAISALRRRGMPISPPASSA